ncbi:MAG: endonuclease, partial [Chitinophagaceae bacterium]
MGLNKYMPEGPSIIIMKEAMIGFKGKTILDAWGTGKADLEKLPGHRIHDIRTLGKQLLIILKGTTVRVHLLMFGTYSVNEKDRPDSRVRLALVFKKGAAYFYTCSVTSVDGDPEEVFDWESDIMGDRWNAAKAKKKLAALGDMLVSDALLDQDVFAGVGNII